MRDMTQGAPHAHLLRYSLPLLLGNWLQLSYNAVDSIIAGRFIGRDALAAEGIAGPVMNLVILAITGLCIGAGVLMSEAFGARDYGRLRRTMANTLLFGGAACCLIALAGALLAPQLLGLLSVPAEIRGVTLAYLRLTFLGAPFTFCYNALAAGLKSVGDAKTPLRFLAISAVLNAALDVVFLGVFGFGIVCSAATTVFAEAVCAALALRHAAKAMPELIPRRGQWTLRPALLRQILRYGLPTALQQAVQPIGKVLIQRQVNALGVSAIAAFHAGARVDDFACIPEQSISSAISTYIAQNRGANKPERIRRGFRVGLAMEAGYWVLVCCIVLALREQLVGVFVTGEAADEVVRLGAQYLGWMAIFYLLPAMTNGFQGFFRGMGKMMTTVLGTFIQTALRTLCTFLLAPRLGITAVAFSCAIGWTAMLLFEIPYYVYTCRKRGLAR